MLPSHLEPFGAVTNEALLAGCYALVSNKAGSSCLIEDGVNGFTFSPKDEKRLSSLMQDVSHLPIEHDESGLKKNKMLVSYDAYMQNMLARFGANSDITSK